MNVVAADDRAGVGTRARLIAPEAFRIAFAGSLLVRSCVLRTLLGSVLAVAMLGVAATNVSAADCTPGVARMRSRLTEKNRFTSALVR